MSFARSRLPTRSGSHFFSDRSYNTRLSQGINPTSMSRANLKFLYFLTISLLAAPFAGAQNMPAPAPPVIGAKSYIVVDAHSGYELASMNADEQLAPASLTKLMTAYAIFRALREEQVRLDDQVTVSENAWRTPGSRMFIQVGTRVSVQDLLLGMIVQSGNDASVALAEHVAGSEPVFAEVMNQYAATLGMHSSHFQNATGLPGDAHFSTARDLAILARAIVNEFPDYYRWYSVKEFQYGDIKQGNRNSLLWQDATVDGMKTGHTDDAGYCLVSSALRDGMRVVSVVLGTASAKARTVGSQALLNYAFRFYETRLLYRAEEKVTDARIWKAEREMSELGLAEDLFITFARGRFNDIETTVNMPSIILGPIAEGQPVAELHVTLGETVLVNQPLRALQDNPLGSIWQRTQDSIALWFE